MPRAAGSSSAARAPGSGTPTATASSTAWPGSWCVNIGHGRTEIADAVQRQMAELSYYNTFFKTTHPPAIALAEMLARLDAAAVQPRLLRRFRLGGERHRHPHGAPLLGEPRQAGQDGPHRPQQRLSRLDHGRRQPWRHEADARAGRPADPRHPPYRPALLVRRRRRGEPGGIRPHRRARAGSRRSRRSARTISPPSSPSRSRAPAASSSRPTTYWPEIARILKGRDILLVADEVITGFGRTGNWFGSRDLRHRGRSDADRQGPFLRLSADRRRHGVRQGRRCADRRRRIQSRLHLFAPIR